MRIVKIKWLDAWIENEISVDEIENRVNQVICTIAGTVIWENAELIAVAAEQVDNIDESITYRAVTFIPKSLIIETKIMEEI